MPCGHRVVSVQLALATVCEGGRFPEGNHTPIGESAPYHYGNAQDNACPSSYSPHYPLAPCSKAKPANFQVWAFCKENTVFFSSVGTNTPQSTNRTIKASSWSGCSDRGAVQAEIVCGHIAVQGFISRSKESGGVIHGNEQSRFGRESILEHRGVLLRLFGDVGFILQVGRSGSDFRGRFLLCHMRFPRLKW